MPRKIILSLVLGLFLTGGAIVLGQQQQQQHQHAQPQNPSRASSFFRDFFGIGEPAASQNQQQSGHNHGSVGNGNNVQTQQQQAQQQQVQQRQAQSQFPQRPVTAPANTNNTTRVQSNALTVNPGATTNPSRVPKRGTASPSNPNESPKIASATPRDTEEMMHNNLNRLRSNFFDQTAESRAEMLRRKAEASLVSRTNIFDSPETGIITSSPGAGISHSSTKKSYVADIGEEEEEVYPEEPKGKREANTDIALPTVTPSQRQKKAIVESGPRSQKNDARDARNVVETDEPEDYGESMVDESIVITTDDTDEEDDETVFVVESPKNQTGIKPKRITSNSSFERGVEEVPAESPPIKSNAMTGVPVLEVKMTGPQKPIVGQELPYQFVVSNRGGVAAEQVVLSVEIPVWAEIQSLDPKVGATTVEPKDDETNLVNWSIDRLNAGESQQIVIHLIPRHRKVLTMNWDHKFRPPISQMVVDVLEPKLEMSLEGPFEMQWGAEDDFRLRIQNIGNGDAEEVQLTLFASGNELPDASDVIPVLKAGQELVLTITALANQPENLEIFVQASGPFGLQTEARRSVRILRPKLMAQVEAPEMQFVDNQSEYRIVVQNTGTATAYNVEIKAMIPSGAKYVSHQGNGRVIPSLQNQVIWTVDMIPAGEEFVCSLVCEMKREGLCQVNISATEKTGLNVLAVAATQVEAIADLVLKLQNPQGPIEVGKVAEHTIIVTNRGSKPAENVEVIAAFASGVSPVSVEGSKAKIDENSGQVFFDKIPVIKPKQSVVLKIKARSDSAGRKRVRAEMVCRGIDTHSVQEETTHYYSKVKGENPTLQKNKTAPGSEAIKLPVLNSARPVTPRQSTEESETPILEPLAENLDELIFEDF